MGAGPLLDDAGAVEVVAVAAGNGADRTIRGLRSEWTGELFSRTRGPMTTVPDEVARLTNLEELRLQYNALTRVSVGVGALELLRVLDLHDNQLETLPDEVGQLTALQQLWLYNNRLTTLPATCSNLTSLIDLQLACV